MKKLLSVVLAVAMLTTVAFSAVGFQASAAGTTSLFPSDASAFVGKDGGDGSITVTKEGDAYVFTATKGWPEASYTLGEAVIELDQEGQYLNYDIVVKGEANIMIFFNGQNPTEEDAKTEDGTAYADCQSINPFIGTGIDNAPFAQVDLPAGTYKGSLELTNFAAQGADGKVKVSGFKVFAVGEGAQVTVNELSVGDKDGEVVTPTTGAATTVAAGTAATTATSSAKTGEESNALLFVVVAAVAVAVVGVSAVASKKAKAK